MGPDGLLFIFSLLDEGALLFLAVYFVSFAEARLIHILQLEFQDDEF